MGYNPFSITQQILKDKRFESLIKINWQNINIKYLYKSYYDKGHENVIFTKIYESIIYVIGKCFFCYYRRHFVVIKLYLDSVQDLPYRVN